MCFMAAASIAAPGGPSVSADGGVAPGIKKPVTMIARCPNSSMCLAAFPMCPKQSGPKLDSDEINPRWAGSRRIKPSILARVTLQVMKLSQS
jgi:hypothetical protein